MVFENTHRKTLGKVMHVRNKPTELKNTFDVLVF